MGLVVFSAILSCVLFYRREFVPSIERGMQNLSLNEVNSSGGRPGAQWNVESASFIPGQGLGQRMMPGMPQYPAGYPQGPQGAPYMPSGADQGLNVEDFPPMPRGPSPTPYGMNRGGQYTAPPKQPPVAQQNQKYYKQQAQQQQV